MSANKIGSVSSTRPKLNLKGQSAEPASVERQISPGLYRISPDHFSPKANKYNNPFIFGTTAAAAGKIKEITSRLRADGPSGPQVIISKNLQQPFRIARFVRFNKQLNISLSDVLLTPLATWGCVSGCIRTATRASRTDQSFMRPKHDVDELVLVCAFCSASVPFGEVIVRVAHSGSAQRTLELLAHLSEQHAAECRGRKGPSLVLQDDVQFGVSETSSGIAATYATSKGKPRIDNA